MGRPDWIAKALNEKFPRGDFSYGEKFSGELFHQPLKLEADDAA
jgi:hypothetical protein